MYKLTIKIKSIVLIVVTVFLLSCSNGSETDESKVNGVDETSSLEKAKADYKAKVSKRMGKVTYNAAVKELGEFGLSETQVKCVLKEKSYASLNINKHTPEVKAVFEGCGVNNDELKEWFD